MEILSYELISLSLSLSFFSDLMTILPILSATPTDSRDARPIEKFDEHNGDRLRDTTIFFFFEIRVKTQNQTKYLRAKSKLKKKNLNDHLVGTWIVVNQLRA